MKRRRLRATTVAAATGTAAASARFCARLLGRYRRARGAGSSLPARGGQRPAAAMAGELVLLRSLARALRRLAAAPAVIERPATGAAPVAGGAAAAPAPAHELRTLETRTLIERIRERTTAFERVVRLEAPAASAAAADGSMRPALTAIAAGPSRAEEAAAAIATPSRWWPVDSPRDLSGESAGPGAVGATSPMIAAAPAAPAIRANARAAAQAPARTPLGRAAARARVPARPPAWSAGLTSVGPAPAAPRPRTPTATATAAAPSDPPWSAAGPAGRRVVVAADISAPRPWSRGAAPPSWVAPSPLGRGSGDTLGRQSGGARSLAEWPLALARPPSVRAPVVTAPSFSPPTRASAPARRTPPDRSHVSAALVPNHDAAFPVAPRPLASAPAAAAPALPPAGSLPLVPRLTPRHPTIEALPFLQRREKTVDVRLLQETVTRRIEETLHRRVIEGVETVVAREMSPDSALARRLGERLYGGLYESLVLEKERMGLG
jgi:hypothetical protein